MSEMRTQTPTTDTTLTKFGIGARVMFVGCGPATVVYTKRKHSVSGYQNHALIRIDHTHDEGEDETFDHYGWSGKDGNLVPADAPHLRLQHNLLWVSWNRLLLEEPNDGFEVDQ